MLKNSKNKIIVSNLKFKEGILNLFSSKEKSTLKLYKDFLNCNLKKLKRVDLTFTRSFVELELMKKTTIPAFDWQVQIVSLNNIFAMMLGIIDSRYDNNNRDLKFQKNFNNTEEINCIETKQNKLCELRNKIIKEYKQLFKREDMEVIKDTINCRPSYKNFENIFKDIQENNYSLSIQGQFISAYMFGYNNSLYINPDEIIPYYDKIMSEYKFFKEKNNYKIKKIKYLITKK